LSYVASPDLHPYEFRRYDEAPHQVKLAGLFFTPPPNEWETLLTKDLHSSAGHEPGILPQGQVPAVQVDEV